MRLCGSIKLNMSLRILPILNDRNVEAWLMSQFPLAFSMVLFIIWIALSEDSGAQIFVISKETGGNDVPEGVSSLNSILQEMFVIT